MTSDHFFSREAAAGYDPDTNGRIRALVVGAGALGQSVALNLALAQVGELTLVDFDTWSLHNATRSPLFGSERERRAHDNLKAPCVASQLAERTHWSDKPRLRYATRRVQELGDGALRWASVVMCCVDDPRSRAYLASLCHRHGRPMIEGGMAGAAGSFAVYDDPAGPCWRCGVPEPDPLLLPAGCDANALEQIRQGFVPMTQPLSAITGAYMAEAAIGLAHGDRSLSGRRVYIDDIRHPALTVVTEAHDHHCPSEHHREPVYPARLTATVETTLGETLSELASLGLEGQILLPAPFIAHAICPGPLHDSSQECGQTVSVNRPDWATERHPRCRACGGEYEPAPDATEAVYHELGVKDVALHGQPMARLGFAPGGWIAVTDGEGNQQFVALAESEPLFTELPESRRRRDPSLGREPRSPA